MYFISYSYYFIFYLYVKIKIENVSENAVTISFIGILELFKGAEQLI